jgi:enamine deaminase RidA (YjgF/YER057c/UK114 family)
MYLFKRKVMQQFEARALELGYQITATSPDNGRFLRAVQAGDFVYTSGHLPITEDQRYIGKVGKEIDIEMAYEAAKLATLHCLASIKGVVGSLDRIQRVVKVMGMVNVAEDFHQTSQVIDGCTHLLRAIMGESGNHARSAVGMVIPSNYAVEIELIVQIRNS